MAGRVSAVRAQAHTRWTALRARLDKGSGAALAHRAARMQLFPAVTLALLAGLGVAFAAHWFLRRITPVDATKAAAEIDVTRVALTVVAGVGGVVALVIAYRRQRDIEQSRFVERFGAAAAQLGATDVAVRIAGVYAMAGVADESDGLRRQQCIDVLCGYLRLPYTPELGGNHQTKNIRKYPAADPSLPEDERHFEYRQNDREVRATIIRVIADHLRLEAAYSWSANSFDFRTAYLEDVDLSQVTFSGCVWFGGATLSGDTWFRGATFTHVAGFGGATFTSPAWFTGATFSSTAEFDGTTFTGTAEFSGATFSSTAGFSGATFAKPVWFRDSTFNGDAVFGNATFGDRAWFDSATFTGHAEFSGATFPGGADFRSVTFSGRAGFGGVTFTEFAGFRDVAFANDAWFGSATFAGHAEFSSATFSGSTGFSGATFVRDAGFCGVTFSDRVGFGGVTFSGRAGFSGVTFTNAWFDEAVFSDRAEFSGTTFTGSTRFDDAIFSGSTGFGDATFTGTARFRGVTFFGDTRFENVDFGSQAISFIGPRQWGPSSPVFDWDHEISHKPANVEPQNWPPAVAAAA